MKPQRAVFELPRYTTTSGRTLKDVRIGYEFYGTLNAARDNAILICHYFTGNAHAAGRYEDSDPLPGWWDGIIGPGKTLDTDRYFVICTDVLCCIRMFDGHAVTTGPSTINPETGEYYGLDFPIPSMSDFVHVQKALLDHLGIERLVAVAGPSSGSMQAIQWAVEYPDMVSRVLAVISAGLKAHPYSRCIVECWAAPIQVDAAWKKGAYDPKEQPMTGLIETIRLTFVTAVSHAFVARAYGDAWADPQRDPLAALDNEYRAHASIGTIASVGAVQCDANHFLYMARTCNAYDVTARIGEAKAKFLFLPAESDLLFLPFMSEEAVEQIRAAGGRAELVMLKGSGGHLDGLNVIAQARQPIVDFLNSD